MVPNRNFAEKYEKLLGRESGLAAARVATPNKHFGFGIFFKYIFLVFNNLVFIMKQIKCT